MLILAGNVRLAPGTRAEAQASLEAMVEASRAEPGCIAYSFGFDVLDERLLHVFEIFEDEAALDAHRASPHMAEWRAAQSQLGIGGRDMSEYLVSGYRKI